MNARSPITTHILDTTQGKPARQVGVTLYKHEGESLREIATGHTNDDGRVEDLLPRGSRAEAGIYSLHFNVRGVIPHGFYPEITICFEIKNPDEHYHVPLLLNPFGYSTYRGT